MRAMDYPRRRAPRGARVTRRLSADHLPDVRGETARRLLGAGLAARVKPGHRVAITAGSRGIGGFPELLGGAADAVRAAGGLPILVPAMGSHGGATAEGQAELLRRLGVREGDIGAPVVATMDTLRLGVSECGAEAHIDRAAAEADGIIVLGRVKTHPESASGLAAGLLKMTTIGLGNQRGAQEAHSHALWPAVRSVPRVTLARAGVLCGVAMVESGYHRPVAVEVVPPTYDAFLEADTRLLRLAQAHFATIPFDDLDLLIVDEIGKDISGAGMDPNVIGRWRLTGGEHTPRYRRIAALSLTPGSLGNGMGIGMADVTTRRFVAAFDEAVTHINSLTAAEPDKAPREASVPLALPTDRDAVEVALRASLAGDAPRVCRIQNTSSLAEMWISEALFAEADRIPGLSRESEPRELPFDAAGDLF